MNTPTKTRPSGLKTFPTLLWHEFRSNFRFFFFWLLGIDAYLFMAIAIYPGEQAVMGFLGLFDQDLFKALLGNIAPGDASAYRLWLSMMLPFFTVAAFIFATMFGVRLAVGAISDDTGELIHTQPLTRLQILSIRFLTGIIDVTLLMIISALSLLIPIDGDMVPIDYTLTFTWWGIVFLIACLSVGLFIGVLAADTGRGYMFSLLLSILLYAFQAMGRILPDLQDSAKYVPLNWYDPGTAILLNKITDNVLIYLAIMFVLGSLFSNLLFLKRDLIKEATIPIPLLYRFRRRGGRSKKSGFRSDKDKWLTLWVRPLEKKLPFTADFIYSDRKALLLTFWAIILFYPVQLMAYEPNNAKFLAGLQETVVGFGNTGFMKVFTYGHDLSGNLWLWFVVTQAVGNHYFLLLPLAAHWIKKVILSDSEQLTGEIVGALPIDRKKVMLQRLLAVLLELLFTVFQMVIWLIISEETTGVKSNREWEIIAIICVIPLYIFLISGGMVLGLLIKNGVKYAQLTLIALILWFIAGISLEKNAGIFGLYDPVLIISKESLTVMNYGVFWLAGLAAIFAMMIITLSSRFEWLQIPKADRAIVKKLSQS